MYPLAESFPNWNPYNYTMQNPINLIDPDGRSASPIYGEDGKYLGTDSEGFSGEVLFMNEQLFNLLSMGRSEGGISHETAVYNSQTLNQVIGQNPKSTFNQLELDMINNSINDISNKLGYNTKELLNGKVSSSYFYDGLGTDSDLALQSNDGTLKYSVASTDSSIPKVSFQIQSWENLGITVENIESTMWHEYGGHHKRGIPGDAYVSDMVKHRNLINQQMARPSFKYTTKEYQKNMLDIRDMYTRILISKGAK